VTGTDVERLRVALGMSVPQFAQLLGVHLGTAYRWESKTGEELRLDPLHEALLLHLHRGVQERRRQADREAWGKKLVAGVLLGGTLAGLAVLLAELSTGSARRTRRRR
jgi:hypothetical protein